MSANADLADEYARQADELRRELEDARAALEQAGELHGKRMAAEDERRTLISQALCNHIGNMTAELRRYEAECDHINAVCDSRIEPPPNLERSP